MKILQISYYFPPMGGAGVQRGLKFSKYLPEHGIRPIVLCAIDSSYVQDRSLADEVPSSLPVHRVSHTTILAKLASRRRAAGATGSSTEVARPRVRGKLRDTLLSAWNTLHYPDDKAGWAREGLRQARKILLREARLGDPVDLIFTSSPPASAHWIGDRLSRDFKLPWVADFRDLWTDNPGYANPSWRRTLDRRLEQLWLNRATGVVTVTESWQRLLASRRSAKRPTIFIPNGYDEEDFFARPPSLPTPGEFKLVHTGTFYGTRDPTFFLDSVSRYLLKFGQGPAALKIRLIGNMGSRFISTAREFDARHPGVIECVDYLPHAGAVEEMMAADALLLVVGGGSGAGLKGWLPGKIFEYLRSGKPVLMLGPPDGDAARLIRQYGSGWVVNDHDGEGIVAALQEMVMGRKSSAGPSCDSHRESATRFERRELARKLAEFMRYCIAVHRDDSLEGPTHV